MLNVTHEYKWCVRIGIPTNPNSNNKSNNNKPEFMSWAGLGRVGENSEWEFVFVDSTHGCGILPAACVCVCVFVVCVCMCE